jgi:peptidyl-prolyl cis-trans isomerase A (cyclophilin A)
MKKWFSAIIALTLIGCNQKVYQNPHILIVTSFGDIEAELFPKQAPQTVAAFLSFIDSGYYNNSSFYRVLLQEGLSTEANTGLIQGGIWKTNDAQHPTVAGIEHEPTSKSRLSHTDGTLSLARLIPGTGNTEFFICIGDQIQFDDGKNINSNTDPGYAAFGTVVNGMKVVRKIQLQPRQSQHFMDKVIIQKIKRL